MVMRPGLQGVVWALPGLILSGWAVLISVAGFATGMPFSLAAEIFGVAIVLSVLWLPVVLYLVGTRLTLDDEGLELRELFGLRVKRLARKRIARIETSVGTVEVLDPRGAIEPVGPIVPVAYYDLVDVDGHRWTRLRSWVWNRNDCERLRDALRRRGEPSATGAAQPAVPWFVGAAAPSATRVEPPIAPADSRTPDARFVSGLKSAAWVVHGCSMLFGFGVAALIAAAAFQIPMGRELGAAALPGAFIGAAIGSSARLAPQVYALLSTERGIAGFGAKAIAALSVLVFPALLWIVAFLVLAAIGRLGGAASS